MQISFDWEYEPLPVKGCKRAKQYVCIDQDLVFTFYPLYEIESVNTNALYLQGRSGVYIAMGEGKLYTGLSESNEGGIMGRFRNHLSGKTKKPFIEDVIMITSVRENPEDFNSEVIRSLEHILYTNSVFANKKDIINAKGKTDYKITGRKGLKQFLKIYGTVCEMLYERNIDCYFPDNIALDTITADDVFNIADEEGQYKASVKSTPSNKLVILKNSRFQIPSRCIFDFEWCSSLFISIINKEHATIVYEGGNFYCVFISDFTCDSSTYKFENLSTLITDQVDNRPKKEWRSESKTKLTLEKYEENKWK